MSVHFTIRSYRKELSCISGKVDPLGVYEVDLEAIKKHRLSSDEVSFYSDVHSIQILRTYQQEWLLDYGLTQHSFLFYDWAISIYDGTGLEVVDGKTVGVMFNPAPILKVINVLINAIDSLYNNHATEFSFDEERRRIAYEDEKKYLVLTKEILEDAVLNDGIIGCFWD